MNRTTLAFALAPLVFVAVLYHDAGALIAFVYSYMLTYLFGIPTFLFLKRRKKETHFRYAFCGAIAAGVLAMFLFEGVLRLIVIFAAVGATEGFCFSLIRGNERKKA
jgi:hypothetical protein